MGFWGSSGKEILKDLSWDGLHYSCHLEVPAGEDAMFQVEVPGEGGEKLEWIARLSDFSSEYFQYLNHIIFAA